MPIFSGIDEAGRGAVLGPLVIALFSIESAYATRLNSLCQKNSKQLSKKQREEIFKELRNIGTIDFIELDAEILNTLMKKETLNEIEARFMAKLIKNSKLELNVKIDLPDRYAWIFAKRMARYGIKKYEAEHKADENYPIVAAASICAKILRDKKIDEIKTKIGDFGSGYPSDKKTILFLKNKETFKKAEPYIRKKWKTLENINQLKLVFE